MKNSCPRCGKEMWPRALTDSDERIYGKWFRCLCGYDTREHSLKEETAVTNWPDLDPAMTATPEFEAVWRKIKTWDINVPGAYVGYCGATGNHVRAILDALYDLQVERALETMALVTALRMGIQLSESGGHGDGEKCPTCHFVQEARKALSLLETGNSK